jgi:outer membrane protein assembly factor BamE (lipoprotein component of BamABCDE complex)
MSRTTWISRDDIQGKPLSILNIYKPYKRLSQLFIVLTLTLTVAACAGKVTQHGHMLTTEDIQQVQPGMSKDQVQLALGSPDTTSTLSGEVFYYISSTRKGVAFLKPKVIGRRVVAVYFNKTDNVDRVGYYGLKDGKVFDFISRTTPSHGSDTNLLKQLLGNFGKKQSIF